MSKLLTRFLIYLLIIFSLFPYIQILPLGTDSQPNALLIGLFLFPFCCKWKMNFNLAITFLFMIVAFFLLFISPLDFNSIRSLMNYMTLFVVSYVSFYALKKINGLPYGLYKKIVYVWFIVGTIQLFVYPDFLSFLIPRGNSEATMESGRGIVCLTPEPTFYGITCLILVLLAYLNFRNKPGIKIIYWILFLQIFIYSRSSLVIFLLIATFGIYLLSSIFRNDKNKIKRIAILSIFAILFFLIINWSKDYITSSRFGKLFFILLENPETFILLDASVNERFIHVFFPIYGFIKDFGMPHGFGSYPNFMVECFQAPEFQHLFTDYVLQRGAPTRIMSGWGSLLYELGIIGVFLVYVLYINISTLLSGQKKLIVFLLMCGILLNAIPFSNPLIPFFIGNLIYLNYE